MVFKQGFFMSQTRLLWSEKKSCFHCKEALFENAAVLIQKNGTAVCVVVPFCLCNDMVVSGLEFACEVEADVLEVLLGHAEHIA